METAITKQIEGKTIRLTAGDCTFTYFSPKPGILHLTITGYDTGQFGTATLDEIRAEIARERPLTLFVDARSAIGPVVKVSDEWSRFFTLNRANLSAVHILVDSKAVYLSVAIAQHRSETGNLIQIYSNPENFEAQRDGR